MNPVETFAIYAAACRAVGCGVITGEQIRELATREDGVDLDALQADAGTLAAAAATAEQALSAERTAVGMLGAAWRGRSASAATDLMERHCAAAANVVTGLAGAADALERLRGRLARLLEAREDAGVRIADRRGDQHPGWLACATAVLAGTADGAALARVAEEIAPFVASDVAGDWFAAMTSVTDEVAAAYREAVEVMADRPAVRFEAPSGVVRQSPPPSGAPRPPPPVAAMPAGPVGAPPAALAPDFTGVPGAAFDQGVFDPGGEPPADTIEKSDAAEPDPKPEPEPEPKPDSKPEPEPEPAPPPPAPAPESPPPPLPAEAGFEPEPEAGEAGPATEPEAAEPTPCEAAAAALPQIGE